ncbi:MAG TPA: hypothetical protein VEZ90_07970, partial [Blastocatellia bacterium]|nr:hypothetical protein [Blastocatellia bacterium]
FLFGALKAERFIGLKVRVLGWYRRAQSPYIEIYSIQTDKEPGESTRCYYRTWLFVSAAAALLIGWVLISIY